MEYLLGTTNDDHSLGSAIRLSHAIRMVPSIGELAVGTEATILHRSGRLDIRVQQNCQALGSFLQVPSRCIFPACVYPLWLLSWRHQSIWAFHSQCCKLALDSLADEYKLTISRPHGEAETVLTPTTVSA
jgi:hypothetical protein